MNDNVNEKGWGKETVFAFTENYCGKFLEFKEAGSKLSMHFHKEKDESLVVLNGTFKLKIINTQNATTEELVLRKGDTWRNPPLLPHQLEALESNSILIEVSTFDDVSDTFRIIPGDSQNYS